MSAWLYDARVVHTRHRPVRHTFEYPLHLLSLDLGEIGALDRGSWLFGYNRARPFSVWDSDYLHEGEAPVAEKLDRLLAGSAYAGRVASARIVTAGRSFRWGFDPVCFFPCYGLDGSLVCLAVEVNNACGEKHVYLVDGALRPPEGALVRATVAKAFYVSPFNDLRGEYDIDVRRLDDQLDVRVDLVREGRRVLAIRLLGQALPMDFRALGLRAARVGRSPALAEPRIFAQGLLLRFLHGLKGHMRPRATSPMTLRRTAPGPRRWPWRALARWLP